MSLDLNHNVNRAIKPLAEKELERITNLLRGILAFKHKLSVEGELDSLHTDIVCFRWFSIGLVLNISELKFLEGC